MVKTLLMIVAAIGCLLFAKAARFEVLSRSPLDAIVAWTMFVACAICTVWLAKLKFAAWAAIFAAITVAVNVLAPLQMPPTWVVPFNIGAGVLCSACVVRNWE